MDDRQLDDALKALLMLRSDMLEREQRMEYRIGEQNRILDREAAGLRRDVAGIVNDAGKKINEEAEQILQSTSKDYRHLVYELAAKVTETNRIIKSWYIGIGCVLAVAIVSLFVVVRYTAGDLESKRAQLENYDKAIEIAKAFANSDAYICEEKLCINSGKDMKNGYRQAKPRLP